MPGVSTMTSWASGRVTMPRTARRVVCGLSEVIAIFSPTMALSRVDLPALGRPTKQAKPDAVPGSERPARVTGRFRDPDGAVGRPARIDAPRSPRSGGRGRPRTGRASDRAAPTTTQPPPAPAPRTRPPPPPPPAARSAAARAGRRWPRRRCGRPRRGPRHPRRRAARPRAPRASVTSLASSASSGSSRHRATFRFCCFGLWFRSRALVASDAGSQRRPGGASGSASGRLTGLRAAVGLCGLLRLGRLLGPGGLSARRLVGLRRPARPSLPCRPCSAFSGLVRLVGSLGLLGALGLLGLLRLAACPLRGLSALAPSGVVVASTPSSAGRQPPDQQRLHPRPPAAVDARFAEQVQGVRPMPPSRAAEPGRAAGPADHRRCRRRRRAARRRTARRDPRPAAGRRPGTSRPAAR